MIDFGGFDFEDLEYNEFPEEPYPEYFHGWDEALSGNQSIHFLEEEELGDIIDIYLHEGKFVKAKRTIEYALNFHPNSEDLVYDILLMLNDYELWNDLLTLAERYQDLPEVWVDGHKIAALFHLGMEEDAFSVFQRAKRKCKDDPDELTFIYEVMGQSLQEVDLFDAALDVLREAIRRVGPNFGLYWLQLETYLAMDNKEEAMKMAAQIEQINPMDGESWHRLGAVYCEVDENEKAIDAFEFAESLGYRESVNYLRLMTVYEKNGNLLKALEKAREYFYLYSGNYMVYILAANICSELNLWEEALEYVNAALRLEPEIDSLYVYKSRFHVHLGEHKKAFSALEEGIRATQDTQGDLKKELEKLQNEYPDNLWEK
jgi:tetratricopeptide (TPR) repeat protein